MRIYLCLQVCRLLRGCDGGLRCDGVVSSGLLLSFATSISTVATTALATAITTTATTTVATTVTTTVAFSAAAKR